MDIPMLGDCGFRSAAVRIALPLGLVFSAIPATEAPAEAKTKTIETAGNVVKFAVPAAGLGLNLLKNDADGALQLAVSWAGAYGTSLLLKQVVREQRPDHSGWDSFPSDSTATAFAAASSIQVRYGWDYGLPAYALAAFVGYSRVEADKHHWGDVAAGAAIGWTIGQLVTSPYRRFPEIQAYADVNHVAVAGSWRW
jgi:membrane-associated phospholipid phosphatase